MLLEVSQKSLYAALQYINPAVSTKGVIPILTGIKLHADYSGLILTAANIGMLMQFKIPNDNEHLIVHFGGNIVIPSRYFIEIIRNMPHDLIKIEIIEGLGVCIQSRKAKYKLNGMNPEEYPQIIKQEHYSRLSFSNHHLKQLIRRVAFAVSSSEARPALTGVLYEINHDQLRFSASDGVRLSSQTTKEFIAENFDKFSSVIIPGKHLFDLSKALIDEHSTTDITIGSNIITFHTNNLTMQSSLIEGTYPSIDRITPETFRSEIIVETYALLRALERVTLLSGENNVVNLLITTAQSIELSSNTAEIGNVVEEILLEELKGEQISISFNGRYMIDIIRVIDCEKVRFRFSDKWKPISVQPIDNLDSLFLITPIRTQI